MSTSVIHYQFKNAGDDFLSIYFEGPVLSTYELKRLIAQQRNIKLDLIDLVITDTETNEIYSDDRQVPKNTSVHVSRVNALKSRTLRSKTTNQATDSFLNDDNSNYYANDPMYASQSSSTSTWNALNKMTTQPKTTTDTYNPNQRRSTSSAYKQVEEQSKRFFNPSSKPLPANYVCKRCHTPGHHIKDCATNGDKLYEPAKAATGIPRSKMRLVSSTDDVDQTNVDSKLMLPGVGQVALIHNKLDFQRYDDDINQSSKTSNMQYGHNNPMSKQAPTQIVYEERDPRTLGINISCLCSLCGDVMNNVAKMTCCDFMGCESCLKKALIKDNPNCIPNDDDFFPCPNCGENMPYIDAIDINQDITNIINNWAYEHSFALDRQRWQDKYKNPNSILDSQGNEQQQNIHPSLSPMIHEPSGFDSSNNSSSSISSLSTGIPLPPPSNLLHDGTTNYSNPISIPSGLQPVEVPPPQAYNPPLLDPPVLDAITSDQSEDIPSTTAIATNDVYELPSTLRPVSPTPTAATNSKYQQNSYQHGYQHQQHHQHKNTYNKWYYGSTQHVNPSLNPHYNNDQSYQNDYPNSTNAPLQQDVNLGCQDQYADEADRTNSRDYNSRNISRDSSRDLDHNAQNISTDVDHPKNILVQLQNQDTETAESHIQVKKGPNRGRSRSRSRSHSPPRSRDYHRFKDRRSRSPGRHYDRRDNRRFNSRSRSRGYDRSRSPSRGYRSRTPSRSRSRSRGYDYSDYSDYSDDYSDYSDDNRDRRDNRDNKRGGASRMHDKGRRGGRGRGGRKFDAPSRGDQGQRDRNNAGGGGGGDRKRRRNRNRNSGGGRK